jgi:cytochrome c oxidase subunit 2
MKRIAFLIVAVALVTLSVPAQTATRVVDIDAKRFEFTPKEIVLKKGEPVTIRLHATDHAHGLLAKPLHIDLDAENGGTDEVTITPSEAGTFPAICDDYCGAGHGNMKMIFVVE